MRHLLVNCVYINQLKSKFPWPSMSRSRDSIKGSHNWRCTSRWAKSRDIWVQRTHV